MNKPLGLSGGEAASRLAEQGPNRLFVPTPVRFWAVAREEVTEPMILLLLTVGVAYSLWGKLGDALAIFAIIATLVAVEAWNEFRAKRAIASLSELSAPKARVIRDGEVKETDAVEVVAGDAVVLTSGTRIVADGKLVQGRIWVDESALTGESIPVEKRLQDPLFAGTAVVSGEGTEEITATGEATRLGQMAQKAARIQLPRTPLQLAMRSLAGKLVWVAGFFALLIPVLGIASGRDWKEMVLTGLALAFAVIPEELPIVITMVLGLGSYRLSRKNFLVKRLVAAETLGSATVIVTDKTGTLTSGKMQVAACFPEEKKGEILEAALGAASELLPDPMEKAISHLAQKENLPPPGHILALRDLGDGRKRKSVLREKDGVAMLFVSGAPEEVLSLCANLAGEASAWVEKEAKMGRRVIALARRLVDKEEVEKSPLDWESLEKDLSLVGFLSFEDPLRPEAAQAVRKAQQAGIRTILVTGDHPATAEAIAVQSGVDTKRVLTGEELEAMDDGALNEALLHASVFARATPMHKHRIVTLLQGMGEVVAVTGDGVNDALALKAANVGIAMGEGTDVAKEAAQAVLADNNYATLAQAIFEGRTFFDNLKKGVGYYLSVKLGLILIFLLPILFGLPLPFSPIQIIVLELFMDLAASAGFVAEPAEKDIYGPRPGRMPILGMPEIAAIACKGVLLFLAVTAVFGLAALKSANPPFLQTMAFGSWMLAHVLLAFFSRKEKTPLLLGKPFANPVMNGWALTALGFFLVAAYIPVLAERFRLMALPIPDLILMAAVAVLAVVPAEAMKLLHLPSSSTFKKIR